jgi:hypothetical protein
MSRKIPLTQGLVALVDDEDFDRVSESRWMAHRMRNTVYAVRKVRNRDGVRRNELMHRFIFGLSDPSVHIDHRDRDGLNNQRANLRITDARGNSGNSRKNKNGLTSKFRGVSWAKHANKFVASLNKRGQRHHLGYFISEEAAARAYDKAATQYFDEFANLNFPATESKMVAFSMK